MLQNKRKNIILLVMVSFLLNSTYAQTLKGRITSYSDAYYSVREAYGKIKKGPRLNDSLFHDQKVVFTRNGNIAQVTEYNSDGTVYCTIKGRTDYKNNRIESVFVRLEHDAMIDRKPFIVESVKYGWGEMCEIAYKNDTTGLPAEEIIYDLMGRELHKIAIKRDENGIPLEYNFSDGTCDRFKYDKNGNRVEWTCRFSNGKTVITTLKYDVSGNLIEEDINDSFKVYYKYHYEHNTFVYRFDKQGNWTERIEYEHDIPERMVVRTIEYAL